MEIIQTSIRRKRKSDELILTVCLYRTNGTFALTVYAGETLKADKATAAFICVDKGVFFLGLDTVHRKGHTMPLHKDNSKAHRQYKAQPQYRFSSKAIAEMMLGGVYPVTCRFEIDPIAVPGPNGLPVYRLTREHKTP
jgi:hypothetical protein